jgi:hypothetical protein
MHRTGERMVTRQFRPAAGGGAPALVRLDSVEFWDFNMQVKDKRKSEEEEGSGLTAIRVYSRVRARALESFSDVLSLARTPNHSWVRALYREY